MLRLVSLFESFADHQRSTLIVIPAQAGIHPAVDTGLRRYDNKEGAAGVGRKSLQPAGLTRGAAHSAMPTADYALLIRPTAIWSSLG